MRLSVPGPASRRTAARPSRRAIQKLMLPPSTLPASVYQNPSHTPKSAPPASFREVPLSGAATNVAALSRM